MLHCELTGGSYRMLKCWWMLYSLVDETAEVVVDVEDVVAELLHQAGAEAVCLHHVEPQSMPEKLHLVNGSPARCQH